MMNCKIRECKVVQHFFMRCLIRWFGRCACVPRTSRSTSKCAPWNLFAARTRAATSKCRGRSTWRIRSRAHSKRWPAPSPSSGAPPSFRCSACRSFQPR
jgi:hypothetical protein